MKKILAGFGMALLLVGFLIGCALSSGEGTAPKVISMNPASGATAVAVTASISATFDEKIKPETITPATFKVTDAGAVAITGTPTLSADGLTATFVPAANLAEGAVYTATINRGVLDLAGNALGSVVTWSFTTAAPIASGPPPVILGTAGNYVILSKAGISTVPTSAITGDIAVSPITAAAITGFVLTMDASNNFATTPQVTGKVYAADYAAPTPSALSTAISDMATAYTDAEGRTLGVINNLYAGDISGKTLPPGLYKWTTGVVINSDVTLSGGPAAVWIFQIAGNLALAANMKVTLSGGALPKNIFWQVAGTGVTAGAGADLEGIVLAKTAISLGSGAVVNGRLYAQTAVTLAANTVTKPAP